MRPMAVSWDSSFKLYLHLNTQTFHKLDTQTGSHEIIVIIIYIYQIYKAPNTYKKALKALYTDKQCPHGHTKGILWKIVLAVFGD